MINWLREIFNSKANYLQMQMDLHKKHNSVRDYTDEELNKELEKAESIPAIILANVCAEILRRQRNSPK